MPLRKMKQKKFAGIYEYYRSSDIDKAAIAYYISVRDEAGVPKKVKTNATSPEEAATALAHYKQTRGTRTLSTSGDLKVTKTTTLNEIADMFFAQRTTVNNPKDRRKYELYIKPLLGKEIVHTITKTIIKNFRSKLQSMEVPLTAKSNKMITLQPKTINTIIDLLYFIINWAYNEEYISTPVPNLTKLSLDNARERIFTTDEMQLIFNSTSEATHMMVLIMYYTALRPESVLRLKKSDISNEKIRVSGIKKQKSFELPIAKKLADELYPWINGLNKDDFIVSKSPIQAKYATISKTISRLFEKLFNEGLDPKTDMKQWASLYSLRHTALTNLYRGTEDIYLVQKIANHSSVAMTQRYAQTDNTLKINALDML